MLFKTIHPSFTFFFRKAMQASFYFHGRLLDFLSVKRKEAAKSFAFSSAPSIKDAIEAIGVPHVEVMKMVVNGSEKDFTYHLQAKDTIEVFPYGNSFPAEAPKSFVLDVHLGKLARLLRMLGIDAVYENNLHDQEIVAIAVRDKRAVLTRDVGLLKHKVLDCGYWLRSQQPEEQLVEVIKQFSLCHAFSPFSRCVRCNGLLWAVSKEAIRHLLLPQTRENFSAFFQCENCQKVYWKGSHFENMQPLIQKIKSIFC